MTPYKGKRMRIVSINEMKEIEQISQSEFCFKEELLIENVGIRAQNSILSHLKEQDLLGSELLFLIGKGSNGADGLSIARHMSNHHYKCRAFVLFSESECKPQMLEQLKMAKAYGVSINFLSSLSELTSYFDQIGPQVIIDGLFGTGVQLPMSNFLYDVIDYVNDQSMFTFSIDIPSGVLGDTGLVQGNAIDANVTWAIGFPKLGHYVGEGAKRSGELEVLDVGFASKLSDKGDKFLLRSEHLADLVVGRDVFADKKLFGHSLVLGGSHGLTGAPILAAQASLRAGAGVVTAATWEPQYLEMTSRIYPEIRTGYLPLDYKKWDTLIKGLNKYASIVIGPGLARSSRSRRLVLEVLNNYDGPVVLDADAINVLNYKEDIKAFTMRNGPTLITPDFGEFAKFTGIDEADLREKPVHYLQELVNAVNCSVVLKGPCTYLGLSDGSVYFNYFPNDGMATGGVGDVLAGILGGLLAQEKSLSQKDRLVNRYKTFNKIAALAVFSHSLSGQIAAENLGVRGMSAYSLLETIPVAFQEIDKSVTHFLQSAGV